MVCRNKDRGETAISEIQSAAGNKNVFLEVFLWSHIINQCMIYYLESQITSWYANFALLPGL